MKRILLLFILLITTAQTIQSQTVVLDTNGVTVKWTGTTVPSPYFVQANPRGTMEWFAIVNNTTINNITNYAKNIQSGITYFTPPNSTIPITFNNIVTTLVTDMSSLFANVTAFNQNIGNWDVGNVTDMTGMFLNTSNFNQPIGSWNVSNVTSMSSMFYQNIAFNQPIGNWNVGNVNYMSLMFYGATSFNQPIGNWNVSNVTSMNYMFSKTTYGAFAFNQNINSWNVGNVTNMSNMFSNNSTFNQFIGNWNVSRVNNMSNMFSNATSFNQPIGNWNVSNVTDMSGMIGGSLQYGNMVFNQNINSWNVGNVTNMSNMFWGATVLNQPFGNWNVSKVNNMLGMFIGVTLSITNYDDLLIGWFTISPNETPLKPNVSFSGGNSKYCNGASARSSIISTYGWTITDAGQGSNCVLDTDQFETNSLKLYPNPVISILNIKAENNLINQPYTIIDGLGRVVLNCKLSEAESTINVEQLSKGIYYLKISGNSATKFIKE